jgi:hypothetical protein
MTSTPASLPDWLGQGVPNEGMTTQIGKGVGLHRECPDSFDNPPLVERLVEHHGRSAG